MTPQNLAFLAGPGRHRLHVGSVGLYDGPAPSLGELRARVDTVLPLVPRARQRIQEVPLRLARPVWVDDADFDVARHVHHIALAGTAGHDVLETTVAELASVEFPRHSPLWAMWLIDGLEAGQWALVTITHQVMVDGLAGTPLLAVLLETSPQTRDLPSLEWEPRDEPTDLRLVGDALTDLAIDPVEVGRVVQSGLRVQGAALRWALDRFRSPEEIHDESGLTGALSGHQRWASGQIALDAVSDIRGAHGVSLDDVVLTGLSGGFRRYLDGSGILDQFDHVRVAVPVAVQSGHRFENELTVVSYDLPVGVADPHERLELIAAQSAALGDSGVAADVLRTLAGTPSARLLALGSRLATLAVQRQRSYHSMVVNAPGPRSARYLLGRRLRVQHPLVPLVDGLRVSVGAMSLGDTLCVSVSGDAEHTPGVERELLAGLMHDLGRLEAGSR